MSTGTAVLEFLSTGGFGTHTTITLFLPVREQGMEEDTMMFSKMFPRKNQRNHVSLFFTFHRIHNMQLKNFPKQGNVVKTSGKLLK